MEFRERLIHELTVADRGEAGKAGWNPYALGHYFRAADDVITGIGNGATPEAAFADAFNATRTMHRVARALGLKLNVVRGEWEVA